MLFSFLPQEMKPEAVPVFSRLISCMHAGSSPLLDHGTSKQQPCWEDARWADISCGAARWYRCGNGTASVIHTAGVATHAAAAAGRQGLYRPAEARLLPKGLICQGTALKPCVCCQTCASSELLTCGLLGKANFACLQAVLLEDVLFIKRDTAIIKTSRLLLSYS